MSVAIELLPDIKVFELKVYGDQRGFFVESYNKRMLADAGIDAEFVQDNHSRSVRHVLRGLHYQVRRPQGKLVRVMTGEVLDVAVDIRRESPTFGRSVSMILSAENTRVLWIPPGFAHGFVVRSEYADFVYKTTDYYFPEYERSILWNDPDLAIDWQLTGEPVLSPKDAKAPRFADAELA